MSEWDETTEEVESLSSEASGDVMSAEDGSVETTVEPLLSEEEDTGASTAAKSPRRWWVWPALFLFVLGVGGAVFLGYRLGRSMQPVVQPLAVSPSNQPVAQPLVASSSDQQVAQPPTTSTSDQGSAPTTAPVVAVVGDRVVTQAELEREIAVGRALYRATQGTAPGAVDEAGVIRQLVDDMLVLQAAEEANVSVSEEEVIAFIEQVKLSMQISDEALTAGLEAEGITLDDLRAVVRRVLTANRFVQAQVIADVPAEETEAVIEEWLTERRTQANVRMQQIALAEPVVGRGEPVVGALVPEFTLQDLEGNSVTPNDLRGQAVLIHFWATWCPPCQIGMSAIEEAYRKYQAQGFQVLAVNVQEQSAEVQSFVQQYGLSFPVLLDETGSVARRYQVRGLPASFFVNRKGAVVATWAGALSPDTIDTYVTQALTSTDEPQDIQLPAADDVHEVHWHVRLKIIIDGVERQLFNLEDGELVDVHRPNTTLGSALKGLGIDYGPDCILELCREGERKGQLVVRINGEVVSDFAEYLLKDGDEVVMELK